MVLMEFKKKILDNGLTIIHEKREVPVTTVMLAVKYGSAYESRGEKGMAHFIEHLCFKGTEKRTANSIAEEIENVGGELNAFTHEEVTAYYAKLPSNKLNIAAEVIFDVFFNASFPQEEVAKEANVICEEIKMYRDNPRAHVMDKIKSFLYEIPFGMSIAGTEGNVRGMTREDLMKKHREVYVPSNAILCVVGNNDFEEVVSVAKKFSVEKKGIFKDLLKPVMKNEKGYEKREDISQTNLAIGVHFPLAFEKERYAAEIFSTILGHGMSSKLFKEVREKRGLVYGVRSDLDLGKNYGYLVIWAGTDPSKTEEVLDICIEEFKKMGGVTEEELEAAKIRLIGGRDVNSEGSNDVAVNLIMEEIHEDAREYYNFEKRVREVSLEEVRALSKKINFSKFYLGP